MLYAILSNLVAIDDVLLVVRANGVTGEMRSNGLGVYEREKYVNIGANDGPCHMHVSRDLVRRAEFVTEQRPERTSFSLRFFDKDGGRVLAGFFTKMYDEHKRLRPERKSLYDGLLAKYGPRVDL